MTTQPMEDTLRFFAGSIDTKAVRQGWTREQATAALMLVAFDEAEHLDDLRCIVEEIKVRLGEMIDEMERTNWEIEQEESRARRRHQRR
jgi:hypothetical protein